MKRSLFNSQSRALSYTVTSFISIFSFFYSTAQVRDFAPIDAMWYYDSMDSGQAPLHSEYFLYQSAKDTVVLNLPCRKIEISKYGYYNTIEGYPPLFVYGDTNEVYYYNTLHDKFCSLYKFNVAIGDTLSYCSLPGIFVTDSTFKVVVDTIYYDTILSRQVKFIYTEPLPTSTGYSFSYWGSYAWYIGGLNNMIPQLTPNISEMDGPLRCYNDSGFSFNNDWPVDCDYRVINYNSVNTPPSQEEDFQIHPNPGNGKFTVNFQNESAKGNLVVSDILGNTLYSRELTGSVKSEIGITLELTSLQPGIYVVQIRSAVPGKSRKLLIQ
jgi:hypothetical protein